MNYPNFHDFYQKALIPMGSNDYSALAANNPFSQSTHWLIALEGELKPQQSREYYHWKVSIYPSNADGAFNWNQSLYTSSGMDSIDEAMELARTFESYSKTDILHTANLLEKIS